MEQGLLAIFLTLQLFEVYLTYHGSGIESYSDHHPLQFFSKFKFKNQRLTWWSLLLQEYSLYVRHVIADYLSCDGTIGVTRLRKFCSNEQNFRIGVDVLR